MSERVFAVQLWFWYSVRRVVTLLKSNAVSDDATIVATATIPDSRYRTK